MVAYDNASFQTLFSKVETINQKVRLQFEIVKLQWELKSKYIELGKYVTDKKEENNKSDFSHDKDFIKQINELITLKLYIVECHKAKTNY